MSPSIHTDGRFGHGRGTLITEPPSISELDDTTLKLDVVSSEPAIVTEEDVFVWEDVIVIREDGRGGTYREGAEGVKIYMASMTDPLCGVVDVWTGVYF